MPSIGPMELIVVLAIALIVLGPSACPTPGKSLGRGIREFKGALTPGERDEPEDDATSSGPTGRRPERTAGRGARGWRVPARPACGSRPGPEPAAGASTGGVPYVWKLSTVLHAPGLALACAPPRSTRSAGWSGS